MRNILNIKKYPDKILKAKCAPVKVVDDKTRDILSDMIFTMHAVSGIGLAAPQIGIKKQIAVVDVGKGPLCLINPKVIGQSGKSTIEEGCLSINDAIIKVKRSENVKVNAIDESGKNVTVNASGLLATVIQHEIDHLNGTLILDHAGFFKKKSLKIKFLNRKKRKAKKVL